MRGFLGSEAPFGADLNLLVQVAMGIALLAGGWLARRKRFAAHAVCQTAVLLLNLVPIALVMWPAFHSQVLPRLPARLAKRHYAVATLHGALGAAGELLAIYVALVAGTGLLPRRWCFRRAKPWMRAALLLWWAAILLGLATYYVWYVLPARH